MSEERRWPEEIESAIAAAAAVARERGHGAVSPAHLGAALLEPDGDWRSTFLWDSIERELRDLDDAGVVASGVRAADGTALTDEAVAILDAAAGSSDPAATLQSAVEWWLDSLPTGDDGLPDYAGFFDPGAGLRDLLTAPPKDLYATRVARFGEWLSRINDYARLSDDERSTLLAVAERSAPRATIDELAATARSLMNGAYDFWIGIADESDYVRALLAQLAARRRRRDISWRRLREFAAGLDESTLGRLAIRVTGHLEETEAPTDDVARLLEETLAAIARGPARVGGWDCGESDVERIGTIVLLAARLHRHELIDTIEWAFDRIRGREGMNIGPLGRLRNGRTVSSSPRSGMTVFIGPPGSGKTTTLETVMMAWNGPLITTTTRASDWDPGAISVLLEKGPVWMFDATGIAPVPHPAVRRVRWSPLTSVRDWDSARRAAYTIAHTVSMSGVTDGGFWETSSYMLIACLLFAAARSDHAMSDVVRWAKDYRNHSTDIQRILNRAADGEDARSQYDSFLRMDDRTLSSVLATVYAALDPFGSTTVQAATTDPNFRMGRDLLHVDGSVIMYADGEETTHTAALYTLFIDEAIRVRKTLANQDWFGHHLLLGLDEVANITPLPSLPGLLTHGPGSGINGVLCFQDIQQASARWRGMGDVFLGSAGHRVVFPGTTSPYLHDWILSLVGAPAAQKRSIGFTGVPAPAPEAAGDALVQRPDIVGLARDQIIVVDPLARVTRAKQVRSFEDPLATAAAIEAAARHDPRNFVVLEGADAAADYGDEDLYDPDLERDIAIRAHTLRYWTDQIDRAAVIGEESEVLKALRVQALEPRWQLALAQYRGGAVNDALTNFAVLDREYAALLDDEDPRIEECQVLMHSCSTIIAREASRRSAFDDLTDDDDDDDGDWFDEPF